MPSRTNDTPRNYYTWDVPNQVFQNSVQRRDMPPMNNNSYVQIAPPMPNRNIGGVQPSSPACVYPNQMPAPQGIYAPTRPGYQGNGHNYQAVNPNGPGYQGYQIGPLAHQQGGGPNYQQQMAYQSGPNYPPRRPSYQEGGQGAGGHDYQSAVPNYQQGGQGVGISSYQPPSSGYQYSQGVGPINVPGRD